jgi:hypothetical protein
MRKAEGGFTMMNQAIGRTMLIPPCPPRFSFRLNQNVPEGTDFPHKIASFLCHTVPQSTPQAQVFRDTFRGIKSTSKSRCPERRIKSFNYKALDSPGIRIARSSYFIQGDFDANNETSGIR